MNDLKARIDVLLEEIEYEHFKTKWPAYLILHGIDKREAHTWAAEIGHVVNTYKKVFGRFAARK